MGSMSFIGSLISVGAKVVGIPATILLGLCISAVTASKQRRVKRERHRQRVEYWGYD